VLKNKSSGSKRRKERRRRMPGLAMVSLYDVAMAAATVKRWMVSECCERDVCTISTGCMHVRDYRLSGVNADVTTESEV